MFVVTGDLMPNQTEEAFLREEFTFGSWRVMEVAIIETGGVGWKDIIAYILREKIPQRRQRSVTPERDVLIAFLKDYDVRRLQCTVCHESEFPHAFECPPGVLEQLGPTTNPKAEAWRAQCWLRHQHPLRVGDTIAFDLDVPAPQISAGTPLIVEWEEGTKNPRFLDAQGTCYQIALWRSLPYTLLPSRPASL